MEAAALPHGRGAAPSSVGTRHGLHITEHNAAESGYWHGQARAVVCVPHGRVTVACWMQAGTSCSRSPSLGGAARALRPLAWALACSTTALCCSTWRMVARDAVHTSQQQGLGAQDASGSASQIHCGQTLGLSQASTAVAGLPGASGRALFLPRNIQGSCCAGSGYVGCSHQAQTSCHCPAGAPGHPSSWTGGEDLRPEDSGRPLGRPT